MSNINQKLKEVSVVMPAYNAERFIDEAIQSVINQSYDNWNLIIVNDGSKDNTKEVILKYVNQYPEKIKLINKEQNEGTVSGLNTLFDAADGEYICWLSADDMYVTNMLEDSVVFLEENKEYDFVFSNYESIDENSNYLKPSPFNKGISELIQGNQSQPYLHLLTVGCCIHGCTVMIRSNCLTEDNRFNHKYRYAHDYDFWLRIAAQYRVGYIDKIHVRAREYSTQITKQGHNEVDAIHVLFDFIETEYFQRLYEKAGFLDRNNALEAIIIGQLKTYKHRKREFEEVLDGLLNYQGNNIKQFLSEGESKWLYNSISWLKNEKWNLKESFFEDDSENSYLKLLCRNLDLDIFLINREGIRFDRFEGNTIERFHNGLMRSNDIIVGTVQKDMFEKYIENKEKDYRWCINNQKNSMLTIGISSFMYLQTDIVEQLNMQNIQITGQDIWWSLVKAITEMNFR